MDAVIGFFSYIQGLGVSVMMPIIITVIGLVLGAGLGKSIKSGLMIGVAFIGLNLVINNLLGTTLAPAVQQMVERFGLELSVIDVGWPAAASIAMGSTVGLLVIPLGMIVNMVMLATNTTQTLDVDIWNYWHFAFTGALVSILTDNVALGFAAAVLNMVIVLVIADVTAPEVEKSLNMPGVSLPQGFSAAYAPIAMVVNWVIDRIPGVRDIDINLNSMQAKLGFFGEPLFLGTAIGLIIGCVAYLDPSNILGTMPSILMLGVSMGAVLVLIPQMAGILGDGITPISEAAAAFIEKRFKNRGKIYIGLDSTVGIGQPVTLSLSLIIIPVMIVLAILLQPLGNRFLPFTDLAAAPYMFVLVTPIVRENGFRGLVTGIIIAALGMFIATAMSPLMSAAALESGFDIAASAGSADALISSLCDGANPLAWLFVFASGLNAYVGLAVIAVLCVALALWNRARIIRVAHHEVADAQMASEAE